MDEQRKENSKDLNTGLFSVQYSIGKSHMIRWIKFKYWKELDFKWFILLESHAPTRRVLKRFTSFKELFYILDCFR